MIYNTEEEIIAYFDGRISEADRWAWWKDGIKWCGTSDISSLQDVKTQLIIDRNNILDYFRVIKKTLPDK